jgi:hypothetical protein
MGEPTSGIDFYGANKKTQKRSFNLEIMFYGFPREKRHIWVNSRKDGLVHTWYIFTYPIILFLLFY